MLANKYNPGELNRKLRDGADSTRALTQEVESSSFDTYHFAKA